MVDTVRVRRQRAKTWLKAQGLYYKDVALRAGIDGSTVGNYFVKPDALGERSRVKIEQALAELGCPAEHLPPQAPPIMPGKVWSFEVPTSVSLQERISLVNQHIADLGRPLERRMAYMGSAVAGHGHAITFTYVEMQAGTDGH